MTGIDIALITAVALLIALAVAGGLQLAQDRAEAHLTAVRREILEWHRSGHGDAPQRYCSICGAQLVPPVPPAL